MLFSANIKHFISPKHYKKTWQTIKNSEKKDEYELDKQEVSKLPFSCLFVTANA